MAKPKKQVPSILLGVLEATGRLLAAQNRTIKAYEVVVANLRRHVAELEKKPGRKK
jgi:hypothetical protein